MSSIIPQVCRLNKESAYIMQFLVKLLGLPNKRNANFYRNSKFLIKFLKKTTTKNKKKRKKEKKTHAFRTGFTKLCFDNSLDTVFYRQHFLSSLIARKMTFN